MSSGLDRLNNLAPETAAAELLKCCGSARWLRRIAAMRPFEHGDDLMAAASAVWWSLGAEDWMEAFRHHPKIGEKAAGGSESSAAKWSADEQAGTRTATADTMAALARANRAYEQKFGYIFIVCASGKSGEEMLSILNERLKNDPELEVRIAAAEQDRITRLRLGKLIEQ